MGLRAARNVTVGAIVSVATVVGSSTVIFASAPGGGVAGNWAVHDHGQGCWGGGNLRMDGTADGGGNCSFKTPAGEEVASLDPVSWSFTDATDMAVDLCATITGKEGPVFPIGVPVPSCIVVPVGTDAPVNLGGNTFGKVTIH